MSLRIIFNDNHRPSGKEFTVSRELRGRATLPGNRTGSAHPQESFSRGNWVDGHAAPTTEEEDVLPDNEGTGISVSDKDGVDLGIVKRNGLNGPFETSSSSISISHARTFPAVAFVEAKIKSWEGRDSR
jgi:hypothetical protein